MKIELLDDAADGPLIHVFRTNADCYVGQARSGASRPLTHFPRNVRRLLGGLPYRAGRPNPWRRVHHAMATAVRSGAPITVEFIPSGIATINADEQRLVREHGATLNAP